ncbi:ATP-binding cassette domain-containing protein [Blochmannia endosymbiont of Colobopsis nipponica]|uniref:metal ABC transporter ATP-binding protein n=1 Tax=Blochmannia endosymbiont of Colobopsis nipponica TaxID=2681987 RepID=UPI00177B4CF7|nr:ATP-binding cassette domain-containing protein [Blochmannia endosymbiont of Colobopsis nipponica]QOI10809.1 ATP-binding cassette domain-containing protein [Blochmannia endosymbiont of Colobopsis nipponica]
MCFYHFQKKAFDYGCEIVCCFGNISFNFGINNTVRVMVCYFLVFTDSMIKLKNVSIGYCGYAISSFLNHYFKLGSMTAVVGNNGSGKTTLLKTIAGKLPPVSGRIEFCVENEFYTSYLAQCPDIDRQFPITVFDVVAMGCWPKIGLLSNIDYFQQKIIWDALLQMKLIHLYHKNIAYLSGGEFQRVLFARLLVQHASLILLDEPFNNIDKQTCDLMMSIIGKLNQQGCTIIMVVHSCYYISKYFSDVLSLKNINEI